jgi:hypothetical protein
MDVKMKIVEQLGSMIRMDQTRMARRSFESKPEIRKIGEVQ